MKFFFDSADKIIRDINNYLEYLGFIIKKFLKNPLFLLSVLFGISLIAIYFGIKNYSETGHIFIIITLIFTALLLFVALGKTYYSLNNSSLDVYKSEKEDTKILSFKTKQIQNQDDSSLSVESRQDNILVVVKKESESFLKQKIINEPISKKIINDLYILVGKYGLFNVYDLPYGIDESVHTKEYFEKGINDLFQKGKTEYPFYLTGTQKKVGAVIFDIVLPFLPNRDASKISEYFFYQKKGNFFKVNYPSIDSPSKREILKNYV